MIPCPSCSLAVAGPIEAYICDLTLLSTSSLFGYYPYAITCFLPLKARYFYNGGPRAQSNSAEEYFRAVLRCKCPLYKASWQLLIILEGTGNKFSGKETDSNILKLYRMLDRTDVSMYTFYQPGIGTYITSHSVRCSLIICLVSHSRRYKRPRLLVESGHGT
jgi:hypothetical protein